MIISRKELLDAAENGTPILNHLDELTEDAMKAIFFERVPICEGSISTKPLISISQEKAISKKLGRNEYVIYKDICYSCGKPVEFKLGKTDIVTHSFPFYRNFGESRKNYRSLRSHWQESSRLADCLCHIPYSSHELLVLKEGMKIWCKECHDNLVSEIEDAAKDFLNGDVPKWASDCNEGLISQEDMWKKELFTVWKVHKETNRVVEFKIDDRYYWLDEEYKKEVNEAYRGKYTSERLYWRKEDIPEREADFSNLPIKGRNKPLGANHDSLPTEFPSLVPFGSATGLNDFLEHDGASGISAIAPTEKTREYIKKACQPCDPSQIVFSKEMMEYVLKAEGVDDGAVMRHNRFLPYEDFLKTPYWYYVSNKVKWAAGQKCSNCGKNVDLQVHHLTYENRGLEARYPEDLICLCKRCHQEIHGKETEQIKYETMPFF